MYLWLAAWILTISTLLVCCAPAHGEAPADRTNIVLFLADDLSWSDCAIYQSDSGYNAGSGIPTPNMERIAKDGLTFTHAFVTSPSCAPSRASLLTGLYPARNGAMFNHTVPEKQHKRWPAWFQELGYEVVAFGKVAHYATVQQYGFDHASHFKYHQDDCVEAAVRWLEQRKSKKPLCLLVGTNWPHVPWPDARNTSRVDVSLPPSMVDTDETRAARLRYSTAVAYADRDLGMLYNAASQHLGKSSLFIFSSDHGSQFPFGKWNCYDAGIRTPLIAVWPGKIAAGRTSDALVSWVDLLPTCIEAADGTAPPSGNESGQISGSSMTIATKSSRSTAATGR
jgi:N-sulfoglucosamine sulfohydrolase